MIGAGGECGKDRDAEFVTFVDQVSPRLLTAAWMLTGDPHTAEDLCRRRSSGSTCGGDGSSPAVTRAYARRIMANLHTDRWRRRRREVLVNDIPESGQEQESRHLDLVRALQALPARERQVVVLRHYLDQSERDTADALGVSVGTVKSSGSRGLARMRAFMDGDESHVNV
ncbi:MAG: sigma-70 family RNA polymerase sigma factor [Ornithinimicrobium sp.]|jgi:RNA polymerase sigma-70 factor (sigma-E family)|uniref:sigma-70 family RNA polymerase sigma factor n=1 Tax=Ornithinimicrobium sp. TaxID=1977084 RepID=UPI001818EBA1|nr:sigma-70 family RNA polymerase sigma factor [Actinomycetota bacterium]